MKTLKEYILEGADLEMRTHDRFFGDKLNRHRDIKTDISKSMMELKKYKSEFSSEEYKMLEELIDNRYDRYREDRSHVSMGSYYDKQTDHEYLSFEYSFHMNNFPKAIMNQIDKGVTRKFPNIKITCNVNSFGTTQSVYGNIYYMNKDKGSNADVINAIKEILSVIKPIYKDLIEFKDDDADRDEVNRRQRQ